MNLLFISLGCDKNLVDSEVMLGLLAKEGYQMVDDEQEADVIVINTCCFIHDAKEESIQTILEMVQYKEEGRLKALIVTGCLAQRYQQEILDESVSQLNRANAMIADDTENVRLLNEKLDAEEKSIIENEERIAALSGELKLVIENLALELDEKMGEEYSVKRRGAADEDVLERIDTILRRIREKIDFYKALPRDMDIHEKLESDFNSLLDAVSALRLSYEGYKKTIPPFIDSLLAPEGLLTKKRSITEEEDQCRRNMERSRQSIASYRQDVSRLNDEIDSLRDTVKSIEIKVASMRGGLESAKQIAQNIRRNIEENTAALDDAQTRVSFYETRISSTADQIREAEGEKEELSSQITQSKAELQDVLGEIRTLNSELSDKESEKEKTIETIHNLRSEIEKAELWASQADEQIKQLFTNFFNTYNRSLNEYQERLSDENLPEQVLVENELNEVRRQIASLGPNINHMAVDDFKEAEERYNFYNKQLDDLNKAKADLEKVLAEIQEKSIQMFMTTYKQISDNFQAMFKRLFNGGRAEITLQDDENVLTSGIDIFAQPPGKKLISLTLLSGGERSMTAVALLFATYLVKPSPFCILDEIDAALDDKNIGYFLSVLEDFSQTSQFIIITHNTHTVMGSQSLLGVTQMEAGVSTTVTYKLANIAGEAVILDEEDRRVDFDKDGKRKDKS